MQEIELWIRIYDHTIATALINAIVALGLYVSLRAGLFNLSVVAFMALGAYTTGILSLRYGVPTYVGCGAGVVVALLIGAVLIYPILRLKGHYLAIATLSFGAIVQALALNLDDLTNGPGGLIGVPKTVELWHLLVILLAVLYFAWIVQFSRMGRAWDAIRTDESAARAMGINVEHYRLVAFLVTTALSALAGALWAHVNRVVVPSEFGFGQLTLVLVNTLLGGISNPVGPVLGAVIVSTMPDWLYKFEQYREAIIGAILVIVVIYLPSGLVAPLRAVKDAIGRLAGRAAVSMAGK